MINIQVFCLASVGVLVMGCAVSALPEFVTKPEPPVEWNVQIETKAGCPNVTGKYVSIPKVADLQQDGLWRVSNGNWYDHLLLIPFNRATAVESTPNQTLPEYSRNSLLIELNEQEGTLRIVSPDKNNENFATHIFSKAARDYTCQAGNLVFPEFKIQGGTEGSFLNGKTYRQATITSSGDLLLYEQTQSHKAFHKYYLFKSKESQGTAG
ncbi:MAG: hypothetical protein QNK19_08300 [Xanthomonadales bacterium]|nr:hypothetical protein [Xanthomonadales bacterium]